MANNRTEAIAAVLAALMPTLTLAQHKALLNDEILSSTVMRKDVIASETPAGGNVIIDYSNKDLATVTTAVDLAVSFTNIENGDVKYLHITKQATNSLTFSGAVNSTNFQEYIDNNTTGVIYAVYNKNSVVFVYALLDTIIKGDLADILSEDEFKFPNCKAIFDYVPSHGAWQTPAYQGNNHDYTTGDFSALRYRKLTNGMLQFAGSVQRESFVTDNILTLPAGFRPANTLSIYGVRETNAVVGGTIDSSGVMNIALGANNPAFLTINIIMPLDLTV